VRTQHYEFAHGALPHLAHTNAPQVLAILNGPDGQRYLNDLWNKAGSRVGAAGAYGDGVPRCVVSATGNNGLVAAIHMPAPNQLAEAFITLIMARFADPESSSLDHLSWVRYFTLEHGLDHRSGASCTFVGEWTADGRHRNLGIGPPAQERAFVEHVLRMLHMDRA